MANDGDWLDALTTSFPGNNPRPLLSWVYGTSAVVGVLTAGLYVIAAFVANALLGAGVLIVALVGLLVWLGLLRIMLEAAAAMFDIRDVVSQIRADTPASSDPAQPQTAAASVAFVAGNPTRPDASRPSVDTGPRIPTADAELVLSPLAVARYLQDQGSSTFDQIAGAMGVELRDVSEAVKELEKDNLVVRHRGGEYAYIGDHLGS